MSNFRTQDSSHDSIDRALVAADRRGEITYVRYDVMDCRYTVTFGNGKTAHLTKREAALVCHAIASVRDPHA